MKATFLFILFFFWFFPFKSFALDNSIIITELLPDALGADGGKEYIEIYNPSYDVSIKDWYFVSTSQSGTSKKISLPEVTIKAKTYFVFAEDLTQLSISDGITLGSGKLALPNDFGRLQLFNQSETLISTVEYGDSKEAIAWNIDGPICNQIILATVNTPGIQNSNYRPDCFSNEAPVSYPPSDIISIEKIQVSLDQNIWTDTLSTAINTPVYFRYQLNKEVKLQNVEWKSSSGELMTNPYTFTTEYNNKITLNASYNGQILNRDSLTISIVNNIPENILITETYPSPESPDKEWIELFNNNSVDINLSNYYIEEKTSSGISNNRKILKNQIIKPREYFVIYEDEFDISLNNSGDTIYLFDINGNKLNQFIYSEADKSKSVGRKLEDSIFSDEVHTTLTPTPNNENQFPNALSTESLNTYTLSDLPSLKGGTEFILNATINNYVDKYIFINDSTGKLKAKLTKTINEDLFSTNVSFKAIVTTTAGIKSLLINPDDIVILDYIDHEFKSFKIEDLTLDQIGDQVMIEGIVKEVYSNRYKIDVGGTLISIYSTNTSDIVKGIDVSVKGTLDFFRNAFRIIEIDHSIAEVEGIVTSSQTSISYPVNPNSLIPQEYKEDYSKIYLVTFGYVTLLIIFIFELAKNKKTVIKFIKRNILDRVNIFSKPVIKY